MQFHLDGFRPGDPEILEPFQTVTPESLPDEVDILIVGCGPAGLTLAAQMAAFPDIQTRIVEQNEERQEVFEAFGFSERVTKEAYWVNETAFWKPDEAEGSHIVRHGRIQDVEDGLSEFPHVILNQARVHDFYLNAMRNSPSRLQPDYSLRLLDLKIDVEASAERPVTASLERTDPKHAGQIREVKARYVVGCDGARSTVLKSLGRALRGDSANQAWGVMDVLAVTDFPDIRLKCLIQSANEGNIVVIPREGGFLVPAAAA